jgi:glucans biosynthesis protein
MRLRCILILLTVLAGSGGRALARFDSVDVTLDYVAKKAEERARRPFHSPKGSLPDILHADKLDYDNYREIRFRHDQALWAKDKAPFQVEFFHPGYLYEEPVHINEFSGGYLQPVRFVQEFFDYGNLHIKKQIPPDTGYAGFRVLCALNQPDKMDELGSFIGASYFRLLGKGQRYGMTARGLALDCGETDRPEEFPIFTDWWLGKPQADDKELHLFALLDSVSCAAAYEFHIRPGESTIAQIDAVVYLREKDKILAVDSQRKPLLTFGMAPLTSMFWYGENSERKFDDYRPEVHDSDGLLMKMGNGEVLWRPLNNASVMRHQRFATKGVKGFGLLQRDRDFASYQDIFNLYHLAPSVWVEPKGDWGEGEIHLVELSTSYEGLDNIVAFWNPKTQPQPLQPYRLGYTLCWTRETDLTLSPDKVVSTRVGVDSRNPKWRQFVIDFYGPKLTSLFEGITPTSAVHCSENGAIVENQVFHVPYSRNWRVVLKMEPKAGNHDPVDLRCTLKKGEENLTETWTYHWSPP